MPPRPDRELMPSEIARLETVRRVGTERSDELAVTFTRGFADDPFKHWMLGTAGDDTNEALWRYSLARLDPSSEVHAMEDSSAVALWVPPVGLRAAPSASDQFDPDAYWQILADATTDQHVTKVKNFIAEMRTMAPDEPVWYLGAIAVDPAAQGQGLGTRLMAPILARCDRTGVPAWLESTNPRNHMFYIRQGFEAVDTCAPADGPSVTGFRRPPRG